MSKSGYASPRTRFNHDVCDYYTRAAESHAFMNKFNALIVSWLLRVSVAPECVSAFNELKLGKGTIKYIIYKLSDDYKEIVVEEKSADGDWEKFQSKLMNAKASYKGREGKGPRYAVYDFEYELEGGEGKRSKITFISWSPDEGALVFPKMTYASSKEALKNSLNGLAAEIQANRDDEIEYATILKDVSKGKR